MGHRSYWLERCAPEELRPVPFAIGGVALARLRGAEPERARRLWSEVGRGFWTEREEWTPARWRSHLDAASTWFGVATSNPEDLGFYELTRAGDQVRIFLHTATDDHPHALPNCLARGNRVHREEPLESPIS